MFMVLPFSGYRYPIFYSDQNLELLLLYCCNCIGIFAMLLLGSFFMFPFCITVIAVIFTLKFGCLKVSPI